MMRIVESRFITSAVKTTDYPETTCLDFAFVGRSNVGKSTMINTLTNRKLLAKTANTPGKTRLINFFDCRFITENKPDKDIVGTPFMVSVPQNHFTLVDLPGYGYARVSKNERYSWQKMINDYLNSRKQLAGIVLLVDSRHTPDPKDLLMSDLLKNLCKNFIVATTKCDKIPSGHVIATLKQIQSTLQIAPSQITAFSAVKKTGADFILNWFETIISSVVLL